MNRHEKNSTTDLQTKKGNTAVKLWSNTINTFRQLSFKKVLDILQVLGTIGVLWYAATQSHSAIRSAQAAEDATKIAAESTKLLSEQFEIDNQPCLFVRDFDLIQFRPGALASVRPRIVNLGKYPTRVNAVKMAWVKTNGVPSRKDAINGFKEELRKAQWEEVSMYLSTEPERNLVTSYNIIDKTSYEDILAERSGLYFGMEFNYINPMSRKDMRFYFIYRIKGTTLADIQNIDVDNIVL